MEVWIGFFSFKLYSNQPKGHYKQPFREKLTPEWTEPTDKQINLTLAIKDLIYQKLIFVEYIPYLIEAFLKPPENQ